MSTDVTHVQLLKVYVNQIDSQLSHLSHLVGAHISALDKTYNKGIHSHPKAVRAPRVLRGTSPLSAGSLLSDALRSIGGSSLRSLSGNTSRSSGGQAMADLASAVSRAMSRDL